MFKKFIAWIKDRWMDYKIDRELSTGTGTSSNNLNITGLIDPTGLELNPSVQHVQDDQQKKYAEALRVIKNKIKKEADRLGGVNKDNLETVLARYQGLDKDGKWTEDLTKPDLLDLTEEEKNVWHKWQYDLKVYKHKDLKSDKDMLDMIDLRISHYRTLQDKKQIRALNRELRKAERMGDKDKISKLWSEINAISGSIQRKNN